MTISQDERLSILQDVSKTWLDLTKAIRKLSDDQIVAPNTIGEWSVKDVMHHISFWERRVLTQLEGLEAGTEVEGIADFEAINRELGGESARLDLNDVREEFENTHYELMQQLEITPFLSRDLIDGNTYDHYREHTAEIRALAK